MRRIKHRLRNNIATVDETCIAGDLKTFILCIYNYKKKENFSKLFFSIDIRRKLLSEEYNNVGNC